MIFGDEVVWEGVRGARPKGLLGTGKRNKGIGEEQEKAYSGALSGLCISAQRSAPASVSTQKDQEHILRVLLRLCVCVCVCFGPEIF